MYQLFCLPRIRKVPGGYIPKFARIEAGRVSQWSKLTNG